MLLLIALLACGDKDPGVVPDADGDGYDVPEDCDDTDPAVNPEGDESCNGKDDDCNGVVDDSPNDGLLWHEDLDGDGYGDPLVTIVACAQPEGWVDDTTDCDDDDATVNPGAPELCDDLDNDCDDDVDEDPIDAATWYRDEDGDGHGDAAQPKAACEEPSGHVEAGDDCDDLDSDVYPGAPELCNDADDDCDDEIDEDPSDGYVWYLDGDGDGYGDASSPILDCEVVKGTTDVGGDCDDEDETQYPGAPELCGDSQVNDCDSDVDEAAATCGGWGLSIDASEVARDSLAADQAAWLGATLAGAFDLDGDGRDDLAVGAFQQPASDGTEAVGAVMVLSPTGPGGADSRVVMLFGDQAGMELGSELASLGDRDGDGASELLVAATMAGDRGQGRVYLLPGGVLPDDPGDALATWDGDGDDEIAGAESLSALGDVDGDGTPDFAVGARYGSLGATYAGQAYVVSGAASGAHSLADASARLYSTSSYGYAAARVAGPGDLDGDGTPDLVIDAVGESAAWIVFGPFSGDVELQADADLRILDAEELTTTCIVGDDLDGDGTADLVLSTTVEATHAERAGAAFVHLGPWTADVELTEADLSILGETAQGYLGGEVALLRDTDGDGWQDLLVGTGSSTIRAGTASALGGSGQAFLFGAIGARTGTLLESQADLVSTNPTSGETFGMDVSSAGDLDGDGRTDLLIGGPGATWGGGLGDAWVLESDLRY